MCADIPDTVPRSVFFAVVENREVALHARGVHRELDSGSAIVIAVDDDLEPFRLRPDVSATEQSDDAVGMWIECANEDVEVMVIVRDACFGAKPWITVLDGIEGPEIGKTCAADQMASSASPSMTGAFVARTATATVGEATGVSLDGVVRLLDATSRCAPTMNGTTRTAGNTAQRTALDSMQCRGWKRDRRMLAGDGRKVRHFIPDVRWKSLGVECHRAVNIVELKREKGLSGCDRHG